LSKKILLISKFSPEAVLVKRDIQEYTTLDVIWVKTAPEAIEAIIKGDISLIVFNFDNFTNAKVDLAEKLRGLGYEIPMILLSKLVAKDASKLIAKMQRTVLLETPYEQKEFSGVIKKFLRGDKVHQRFYRRFYTNQISKIEIFKNRKELNGKVKNLSLGGAFLEFDGTMLRVGDVIRLRFELKEVNRSYDVMAKIAWIVEKSPWGDGRDAGLRFVKTEEVYQSLLKRM
jgi:response regulator RpfG family c-di-GMP phosphodiesterase